MTQTTLFETLHTNAVTKKPYEGHNQQLLEKMRIERGYTSYEWMTFVQAKNKGLKVKRGAKSVKITGAFTNRDEETEQTSLNFRPVYLFNKDCTCEKEQ